MAMMNAWLAVTGAPAYRRFLIRLPTGWAMSMSYVSGASSPPMMS